MSVRVKTSSGWVNVAGNELGLISKPWNGDDTYTIGEYVYHKSFIWKCLAQNENEEPTDDSEYWEKIDSVMSEVFQYVSNGKELVADAITDKGVATSKTDTFATMATNISQISGGGGLPNIDFSQPPLYRNEIDVVQKPSRDCVYSPNLPKGRYAFIFYTYYYTTSDISYSIGSIKVNNTAITNYHTDINSKDTGSGYQGQGLTAVGVVDINDATDTITVNCNFIAYPTLYIYKLNGTAETFIGDVELTNESSFATSFKGQTLNISDHLNLANYIKDTFGSYNHFGGDGIDTFRLPSDVLDQRGLVSPQYKSSHAGVINSAEYSSDYGGWCAFSQSTSNEMSLTNPIGGYIGYNFGKPTLVNAYKIRTRSNGGSLYMTPTAWDFQGRNSDSDEWTTIKHQTCDAWTYALEEKYFVAPCDILYSQYRIISTADSTNTNYFGCNEVQFFSLYGMIEQGSIQTKTVYDLGYVDDSMLFWLDGKSTTPSPYDTEAGEEPLVFWSMKKCRIEGETSFKFGSDNHWKEGGGLTFIKTRNSWGWYATYFQTPANVTIEVYFDGNNFSTGNNEIVSSRESGGIMIGVWGGGKPYCGTTVGDITDDTTTIQANTKYHIAFTYDRQNMKLYVNGVLKKTVANTSAITSAGTGWWLGNDGMGSSTESDPSNYAFEGTIYSMRMYDRVLDADEILSNYQIDVNRFGA